MNLKQFLKPEWRKIAIFLILIGSTYFLPLIPMSFKCPPCPPGAICVPCRPQAFNLMRLPEVLNYIKPVEYGYMIHYPLLLIELTIFYLLSCLIIWIYDKLKKK